MLPVPVAVLVVLPVLGEVIVVPPLGVLVAPVDGVVTVAVPVVVPVEPVLVTVDGVIAVCTSGWAAMLGTLLGTWSDS